MKNLRRYCPFRFFDKPLTRVALNFRSAIVRKMHPLHLSQTIPSQNSGNYWMNTKKHWRYETLTIRYYSLDGHSSFSNDLLFCDFPDYKMNKIKSNITDGGLHLHIIWLTVFVHRRTFLQNYLQLASTILYLGLTPISLEKWSMKLIRAEQFLINAWNRC